MAQRKTKFGFWDDEDWVAMPQGFSQQDKMLASGQLSADWESDPSQYTTITRNGKKVKVPFHERGNHGLIAQHLQKGDQVDPVLLQNHWAGFTGQDGGPGSDWYTKPGYSNLPDRNMSFADFANSGRGVFDASGTYRGGGLDGNWYDTGWTDPSGGGLGGFVKDFAKSPAAIAIGGMVGAGALGLGQGAAGAAAGAGAPVGQIPLFGQAPLAGVPVVGEALGPLAAGGAAVGGAQTFPLSAATSTGAGFPVGTSIAAGAPGGSSGGGLADILRAGSAATRLMPTKEDKNKGVNALGGLVNSVGGIYSSGRMQDSAEAFQKTLEQQYNDALNFVKERYAYDKAGAEERYASEQGIRQPEIANYHDILQNPETFYQRPDVQAGTNAVLRGLSADVGNPINNRTALDKASAYSYGNYNSALNSSRNRIGPQPQFNLGGSYSLPTPDNTGYLGSLMAQRGVYDAYGNAAQNTLGGNNLSDILGAGATVVDTVGKGWDWLNNTWGR